VKTGGGVSAAIAETLKLPARQTAPARMPIVKFPACLDIGSSSVTQAANIEKQIIPLSPLTFECGKENTHASVRPESRARLRSPSCAERSSEFRRVRLRRFGHVAGGAVPFLEDFLVVLGRHGLQLDVGVAQAAQGVEERMWLMAKAARALSASGDTTGAVKAWRTIADDPRASSLAAEARVRLGELLAKPARRG